MILWILLDSFWLTDWFCLFCFGTMEPVKPKDGDTCLNGLLYIVAATKAFFIFCMMLIIAGVVSCLRCIRTCCGYKCNRLDPVMYEDWFTFNLNCSALSTVTKEAYMDLTCSLKLGSTAPDISLVSLEGADTMLSDFQRGSKPLVVNFGSCSWLPFMSNVDSYNAMVTKYGQVANFLTVYTSEAHPLDGWALLNHEKFSRSQHTTIKERITAAHVLKSEGLQGGLVADSIKNEGPILYGSLPERLYVIQDGFIRFKGGRGPFMYNIDDVRAWLDKNTPL